MVSVVESLNVSLSVSWTYKMSMIIAMLLYYLSVGLVVDAGCRLVEHDDFGRPQHSARDAQQLPLADGQIRPALVKHKFQGLLRSRLVITTMLLYQQVRETRPREGVPYLRG
jgi:hypothetical protein